MTKASKLSQYRLACRLARRLYGHEGHAWRDKASSGLVADRYGGEFVRRATWGEVIKVLQAAIAAKPERAA